MALSCIWFRRACSKCAVLGEPVPTGSRLETHLAGCEACREYWSELRILASDLDSLVSVPRPSAAYAEPIWDRVRPTVRSYRWGGAALATAAACGLACGLVWWRLAASAVRPQTTIQLVKQGTGSANKALATSPPVEKGTESPERSVREIAPAPIRSPSPHLVKWAPNRIHFRPERLAAHNRPRHIPAIDISNSPEALQASGRIYESQGDPGLANVAYQAAYQQRPSDDTAFDVGRSAEESGDMEQAMNAYAGLLDAAAARTQSQKGWTP
jgi:hypothetical protein